MRHFGIPLGLAALAHLMGLWGFAPWRELMVVPAGVLGAFIAQDVWLALGGGLALHANDDVPYAAWSAAVVLVVSTALPLGHVALDLWCAGAIAAIVFFLLGVPQTWRHRSRMDMAHIAWYTPALIAALDAPHGVNHALRTGFGWFGFAGMGVVIAFSAIRVARGHDPKDMRSPWYGLGGSAVMALWVLDVLPPTAALGACIVLACAWLFWVVSVAIRHGWDAQGAWSNLFSLCSMAAVAIHIHLLPLAAALTVVAVVSLMVDIWRTVSPPSIDRIFLDTESLS